MSDADRPDPENSIPLDDPSKAASDGSDKADVQVDEGDIFQSVPLTDEQLASVEQGATPADGYRPELPDHGVYLRWPANDNYWLHPEDVDQGLQWIPSRRVFRRERWDGEFYWLTYGKVTLRVRPSLWTVVRDVDLQVDEQVELLSRHGENDAGIYYIAEILYNPRFGMVEYFLRRDQLGIPQAFRREDLSPLHIDHQLRQGFYEHTEQTCDIPEDMELLDVGDLLDDGDEKLDTPP